MSHYVYTCACCGTQWDRTSTGRYPTPKELAGMVCQPCREAPRRIAALEAENAALRERWDNAMLEAQEAAGHEFGLWPMGAAVEVAALREDKARLDWLQEENVDTIYMDDGKIIDVRSGNLRAAIDAARKGPL